MSADIILNVSSLNEHVRQSLAKDPLLRSLRLRGEISNLKRHSSGHLYFSLKDEKSRIACVMFRQHAMGLSLSPADGMQVILSGSVGLYPEAGTYQFYATGMRPDGVGALYQQFEQLKSRLLAEGLLDEARKRPLPLRPRKIAVVTSPTGAVLQDIRRVAGRRDPGVPLVVLPVTVQGGTAAREIAAAIELAGRIPEVDVIITGRGGGSMEDLWAFNEERVARAIAASPIPVISAVGHETDFTMADFVADVRASTPSNAAELAVPERTWLKEALGTLARQLTQSMMQQIYTCQHLMQRLRGMVERSHPEVRISTLQGRLARTEGRLNMAIQALVQHGNSQLMTIQTRIQQRMTQQSAQMGQRLASLRGKITALNPKGVLSRGYALVQRGEALVSSASEAAASPQLSLHFHDGVVEVYPSAPSAGNRPGKGKE